MPRIVSVFLCCFIVGVIIGSLYFVAPSFLLMVLLGVLGVAVSMFFFNRDFAIAVMIMALGLALGLWYVNRSFGANEYEKYVGQKVDVEGIISADPVDLDKGQQVTVRPEGYTQDLRAKLYTAIPGATKGDRVWIRGQIELPENFSEFDYVGYLQRWGVYAELKKPRVIVLKHAPWSWRTPLLGIRNYVQNQTKAYPQKEGSLILGILIGLRQDIPDDITQAFKTTGLTHIVAVSGFNMTIIASACGVLVWYLGRRATNLLILVIVFGFVVITGATASVVRAAIMAVLMVMAQLLGRQYASLYALLIVCAIMILQNPRIVVWDIGFQLSVAATFGVLIAFRIKDPETKENFLSETLRPTMGAIAITAPIIAYHFETFSVIAPIANLLVLPFVSWIMLFSGLALLPLIGPAFVYPAQILTSIVLFLTVNIAKVPYASIAVHLPIWAYGIYYIVLFWYIHHRQKTSQKLVD